MSGDADNGFGRWARRNSTKRPALVREGTRLSLRVIPRGYCGKQDVAQEPSNRTTFAGCHVYRSFRLGVSRLPTLDPFLGCRMCCCYYINNAGPGRQHKKQRYEWLLHFSSLNSPQFQAAISNHLADCFSGCTRIEDQRGGHGAPAKVALASTRRNENEEFTAVNYIGMLTANMWVCLKMGYTPNYSHLVGIMIINHWV